MLIREQPRLAGLFSRAAGFAGAFIEPQRRQIVLRGDRGVGHIAVDAGDHRVALAEAVQPDQSLARRFQLARLVLLYGESETGLLGERPAVLVVAERLEALGRRRAAALLQQPLRAAVGQRVVEHGSV